MIFTKDRNISDRDKEIVNNLLECLINKSREACQSKVEDNGFIFLDSWDNKMGFVKERKDEELILSLQFDDQTDSTCYNYQLIIKKSNQHWKFSHLLDHDLARNASIIGATLLFIAKLSSNLPIEPTLYALGG
ncbi:MAG TPA: hypothetical protein VJ964_06810 [Balneolaceae bacterium]|nr:hypothetical protein [Balneolaceae bacterium]